MGMKVGKTFMNDLLGVPVPKDGEELLTAAPATPLFGGGDLPPASQPTLHAATSPARQAHDAIATLVDQAEQLCAPGLDALIDEVRDVIASSESFEEVKERLAKLKPSMAEKNLAGLVRMARVVADLSGRADILDA
jgi:phage gp29-like protein